MKRTNSRLKLSKEVIAQLSKEQTSGVVGGAPTVDADCQIGGTMDSVLSHVKCDVKSYVVLAHTIGAGPTTTPPGHYFRLVEACIINE